jgi:hypothetical protein
VKIVKVTWLDAHHESGFAKPDDVHTSPLVTVGFMLRDNADEIAVAMEFWPEENKYRDTTVIPRSLVQEIVEVR